MASLAAAFDLVNTGDADGLDRVLLSKLVGVNDVDSHGMTLLHHASYRGQADICQLLLDRGADASCDVHEHAYTPLHFAALSGSLPTVSLLLAAGADRKKVNSVGRSPSQMAAFVGNHAVTALINNYVSREMIDYYTVARGLETEPKLPPQLAAAVHRLLTEINLHPVHLLLVIERLAGLSARLPAVVQVLRCVSERQMQLGCDQGQELLAVKAHYLSFVLETIYDRCCEGDAADMHSRFVKLAHFWLRCTDDMVEQNLNGYVRECIKAFPHRELPLFKELVANLVHGDSDKNSSICAFDLLNGAIYGQRGFQDDNQCAACRETGKCKRCVKCHTIHYCGRECQRIHWPIHKRFCPILKEKNCQKAIVSSNGH